MTVAKKPGIKALKDLRFITSVAGPIMIPEITRKHTRSIEKAREINQTDENVNLNYALALEADEQYLNAAKIYGSLIRSKTLKDTALFRSAMCWIKKRDDKFYNEALTNLTAYLNGNGNADKSLVYAWMGFIALLNSDFNQVNEYIGKSQVVIIKNNPCYIT